MKVRAPAGALALLIAAALIAAACDRGSGDDASITPPPASAARVRVAMTSGCDQSQPELGWEALALVSVTDADGAPVVDAMVVGDAHGPGVAQNIASDATYLDGEALLLFPVTQPGEYTIAVAAVTLPGGEAARYLPESTLTTTVEIGDACVPPR